MPQYPLTHSKRPKRKVAIGAVAVTLVLVWHPACQNSCARPATTDPAARHGLYTTDFPLTENPITEGGRWVNGQAVGIDWANIRTTPGYAFGTESGTVRYGDSTALLAGTWGPDQAVQATVHSVNQSDSIFEEVELRLRSSLSPHRATGYEVNFRCSKTPAAYTQIVRWNGRLGRFTILKTIQGSQYGVATGDVVRATIIGNVITSYINGVQVLQTTDNTFRSGNPGMGFYLQGTIGANADFGFTRFAATDGPPADLQASAAGASHWRREGLLPGLLSRSQALFASR